MNRDDRKKEIRALEDAILFAEFRMHALRDELRARLAVGARNCDGEGDALFPRKDPDHK